MSTQRIATATAALAFFVSTLDTGILSAALPTIAVKLNTDAAHAAANVTTYAGALSLTILFFGYVADRIGAARIVLAGFIVFGVFTVGCALARSLDALLIFRGLTGIGAAMLQATAGACVARYVDAERRPSAFATVSAILSIGVIVGPSLGGLIITFAPWPWIFYATVPVCAAGALLAFALRARPLAPIVPAGREAGAETKSMTQTGLPFACAAILGAMFIVVFVTAPFALHRAGWNSLVTGCTLLATPLGAAIAAKLTQRPLRAGYGWHAIVIGLLVSSAACVALLFSSAHVIWIFGSLLIVFGIGSGMLQTPTIAFCTEAFGAARAARGGAMQRFVQNIAIAGMAALTGVIIDRLGIVYAWGSSAVIGFAFALLVVVVLMKRPAETSTGLSLLGRRSS